MLYTYNAKLIKVIDGDTVRLKIDLGFKMYFEANCRLAGINAPEMKSGGNEAKEILTEMLSDGIHLIESKSIDKYGRPLVRIYVKDKCVNDELVTLKLAKVY